MLRFDTKDALIEAKAKSQHDANLDRGGVFGASGERISDLDIERRAAANKVVFVGAAYSRIHGLPEYCDAWYIAKYGYAPIDGQTGKETTS